MVILKVSLLEIFFSASLMLIHSPENDFYMLSCYGNLVGVGNLLIESFDFRMDIIIR